MNTWATVRIVIVAAGFLLPIALGTATPAPPGVTISLLLAIFVFGVVGMLFVIGIQRINRFSAPIWRYPSWSANPFSFRQPLQFFHLAGFFFIASAAGDAVQELVLGQSLDLRDLFFPAFGAGILCGVYVCTFVYRSKMESSNAA